MRAVRHPRPLCLALASSLAACAPAKDETQPKSAPKAAVGSKPATPPPTTPEPRPGPPVEFAPTEPPALLTGPATTLSFDAEAPPMWFDNPVCKSRYARAQTLHVDLPQTVDIDVTRLHALRAYSAHTLVWTPQAAEHLVETKAARTRTRARWRLAPGTPVELWVIDANPSAEDAERCWDAVKVHGTVEWQSADDSLGITAQPRSLQLTPTSTRLSISASIEDFGLAFTPGTLAKDPSAELHVDLPVTNPRSVVPERVDNRGLTPIEAWFAVTVDKTATIGGQPRDLRGIDYLAVSEESAEAREVLGGGPN